MRILFLTCCIEGENIGMVFGITALATYLNAQTSHEARLLDFNLRRTRWSRRLCASLSTFRPHVVGVHTPTTHLGAVHKLMKRIRRFNPRVRIVLGGPHPTLDPLDTIRRLQPDAAFSGYAEESLAAYLDALASGASVDHIPGISVRSNGAVRSCPVAPPRPRDEYPFPDFSLRENMPDVVRTYGVLDLYGGMRMCPYACTYCAAEGLRRAKRAPFMLNCPERYARYAKHQYDRYRAYGIRCIWFFDPVFTQSLKWVKRFGAEYRRLGLAETVPFSVYSRADALTAEMVQALRACGGRHVRIGVESGSEHIRNVIYRKREPNRVFHRAVDLCRRSGIQVTGFFCIGAPGETWRSLGQTWRLLQSLDLDTIQVYVWKPLAGTKAVDLLHEHGGHIRRSWKKGTTADIHSRSVVRLGSVPCMAVNAAHKAFLLYGLLAKLRNHARRLGPRAATVYARSLRCTLRQRSLSATERAKLMVFHADLECYRLAPEGGARANSSAACADAASGPAPPAAGTGSFGRPEKAAQPPSS